MAGSVNKVTLLGNVGADPEVRSLNSGDKVVSLRLATSESWRDKNSGEKKEKTEWHNVVIFNEGLGKVAEQYVKKGSKIYIEGQLQTRKWQDKDGHDRYTTEVVLQKFRGELQMVGGKDDKGEGESRSKKEDSRSKQESKGSKSTAGSGGFGGSYDDDIPFAPEFRL